MMLRIKQQRSKIKEQRTNDSTVTAHCSLLIVSAIERSLL